MKIMLTALMCIFTNAHAATFAIKNQTQDAFALEIMNAQPASCLSVLHQHTLDAGQVIQASCDEEELFSNVLYIYSKSNPNIGDSYTLSNDPKRSQEHEGIESEGPYEWVLEEMTSGFTITIRDASNPQDIRGTAQEHREEAQRIA